VGKNGVIVNRPSREKVQGRFTRENRAPAHGKVKIREKGKQQSPKRGGIDDQEGVPWSGRIVGCASLIKKTGEERGGKQLYACLIEGKIPLRVQAVEATVRRSSSRALKRTRKGLSRCIRAGETKGQDERVDHPQESATLRYVRGRADKTARGEGKGLPGAAQRKTSA